MASLGTPTTSKTPFVQAIFLGLNSIPGLHVYAGTVSEAEVARRRVKNKVARNSRRANRGTK